MTKPLSYEKWVTKFVENVSAHFDFSGWRIVVESHNDEDKGGTYAETSINSAYQFATVHLYKAAYKDFQDNKPELLIMSLVHELVHIFIDPFHAWAEPHLSQITTPRFMDIVEQQTQKLTMVFLKTLPKGLLPPR
jgi:hypothetical protein